MKTAVSLPAPVFEAAEQLAKRLGMSRSELYASAIAEFIQQHRGQGVSDLLNQVYGSEESSLDPALETLQARSLPREKW
jgi:metal-responsive CopG/Arc/MetJ family transcriptional regulator